MYTPQFADLQFANQTYLDKWLDKNTHIKIDLEDVGHDLLTIWMHKSGEILHSDAHSAIYSGMFIDINRLEKGIWIYIWEPSQSKFMPYCGLRVDKLTIVNK